MTGPLLWRTGLRIVENLRVELDIVTERANALAEEIGEDPPIVLAAILMAAARLPYPATTVAYYLDRPSLLSWIAAVKTRTETTHD